MTNRAIGFCLVVLIFEGSTTAFFTTSTKFRLQQPLRNAYLETLTISDEGNKGTSSAAATASTHHSSAHNLFPTHLPIVDSGGDELRSSPDEKTMITKDTTKEDGQKTTYAEAFPTLPKVTQHHSGWTQVESEKLQDGKEFRKASYESERKKYDQASFAHDSRTESSREQNFQPDEEIEGVVVPATVVEVLPKDPPLSLDDGPHHYLASKNMELEQENSDLQQENERQK